jgi:hypothetical protein
VRSRVGLTFHAGWINIRSGATWNASENMKAIVKTNGFVLCHVGNLARNVIFAAIILYLLASLGMAQSPLPDSIV